MYDDPRRTSGNRVIVGHDGEGMVKEQFIPCGKSSLGSPEGRGPNALLVETIVLGHSRSHSSDKRFT